MYFVCVFSCNFLPLCLSEALPDSRQPLSVARQSRDRASVSILHPSYNWYDLWHWNHSEILCNALLTHSESPSRFTIQQLNTTRTKNKDSPEQQRLIVAWSECQEIKSAVTHLFGVPSSQSQRGTYFGDTQMNPLHTVSESAVCPLSKPQFLHESQCVPVCVIITVFFLFYQKPVKPLCHGFCQMFAIVTFFNGLLPK